MQALSNQKTPGDVLAVNRDSKSASLTLARTAVACARDSRYP
jgi:hypothetical protein